MNPQNNQNEKESIDLNSNENLNNDINNKNNINNNNLNNNNNDENKVDLSNLNNESQIINNRGPLERYPLEHGRIPLQKTRCKHHFRACLPGEEAVP